MATNVGRGGTLEPLRPEFIQTELRDALRDGLAAQVPLVMGSAGQQKPDEQASRYCHECHAVERP